MRNQLARIRLVEAREQAAFRAAQNDRENAARRRSERRRKKRLRRVDRSVVRGGGRSVENIQRPTRLNGAKREAASVDGNPGRRLARVSHESL